MMTGFIRCLFVSTLGMGLLGGCAGADGASQADMGGEETVAEQSAALQINGLFRLRNFKNPDICAGVQRGTMNAGVGIIPWSCNGSRDQQWRNGAFINPVPGFNIPPPGYGQLVNNGTDSTRPMCLDGTHDARGLPAIINDCALSSWQAWHLEDGFSATLRIAGVNRNLLCYRVRYGATSEGQVLGVERGDVRNDGGRVIHWTDLNPVSLTKASDVATPDQIWCADPTN